MEKKHRFLNLLTTIGGLIFGSPSLIEGINNGDKKQIFLGVGTIILGLFAKDK